MSGGSFNYAYCKVGDQSVFEGLEDYKAIERYLRKEGRHLAADEVLKFVLEIETARHRLDVIGERVMDILRAAEMVASGDTNIGAVDAAYNDLVKPIS